MVVYTPMAMGQAGTRAMELSTNWFKFCPGSRKPPEVGADLEENAPAAMQENARKF